MNSKYLYISLGIIQIFVAFGAIPVGFMMIANPDWSSLGMPLSLLKNSLVLKIIEDEIKLQFEQLLEKKII